MKARKKAGIEHRQPARRDRPQRFSLVFTAIKTPSADWNIDEAREAAGIVAGGASKTGKLGFIAAKTKFISGEISGSESQP